MPTTSADFIESIVDGVVDEAKQIIRDNREGLGERVPFTRKMTQKEKYELWFNIQSLGEQGWTEFLTQIAPKYADPQMLLKDVIGFAVWGQKQTEKSLVTVEGMEEEMEYEMS